MDLLQQYLSGQITKEQFMAEVQKRGGDMYNTVTNKAQEIMNGPMGRVISTILSPVAPGLAKSMITPRKPQEGENSGSSMNTESQNSGTGQRNQKPPVVIVPNRNPKKEENSSTGTLGKSPVLRKKQLKSKITERKTVSEPVTPTRKLTEDEKWELRKYGRNPRL